MKLVLTAACLFLFNILYCQQDGARLSGSVNDEAGNQVLVGDAILYIGDSIFYHSTILDGKFEMNDIANENYLLKIKCLGYQEYIETLAIKSDLNLQIELEEDATLLEEVTITSVRDNITFENGNVKVNLVNSIFAEQASTLDALSMMPGIITDPVSQTISLIASGSPLLYIGNRNISMDEFLAIPITNIDVIEIINNPSAKYEASGRSVILITLLKGLDDGIRVELSNNAVKRRHFNNYAVVNGSLRKERFEVKSNFGFNSLNTWEGADNTIEVLDKGIKSTNSVVSKGDRPQFIGGVGLFYSLNESDYLSINGNFRKHTTDAPLNSYSITSFPDRIDTVNTFLAEDEDRGFYTANVNYNNEFGENNLFAGVQMSRYHRGVKSEIFNDLNPLSSMVETRDQDYVIDVIAGRLDYEATFNPNLKLELGTNIYSGIADAFQKFVSGTNGSESIANYDYEERNVAFYGQFVGKLLDINYTVGLRSEMTHFYGKFKEAQTPLIDRDQTNLFPRLNLSYKLDEKNSLNLNFSSSIRRPNYLNATSISTYITPYIEYQRNANLAPSPARYLSINYQHQRQSVNVTGYTRDNLVQQSAYFDNTSGRIITSPENFKLERGLNIRVNNYYALKKWSFNFMTMLSFNQLKDDRGLTQKITPFLYVYTNQRFALPKNFTLSANFYALTRRNSGIYDRNARAILGASLSKTYKNFTFSINASDIFKQFNNEEEYTVNSIRVDSQHYGDVQSIGLNLRYVFGKKFKSAFQNEDVDENLDRMR